MTHDSRRRVLAQYLFLLRSHVQDPPDEPPDEAEFQGMFERFVRWTNELAEAGQLVAVERLQGVEEGRVLKGRPGRLVVDGPYAETKEAVVGLYIVEAESLERAIQIAKGCPGLDGTLSIEVRSIGSFPKPT